MSKLKAWVRFDGNKNAVPGSLILRNTKPKVGTWREVTYNLCCNNTPLGPIPFAPLFIYDFQIECENFCSTSIEVNGEEVPFPICEAPLNFSQLVLLLQETFPTTNIVGIPAIPPPGGTITITSSTFVFGSITTENCGVISPIVSNLDALRFGYVSFKNEEAFRKAYTQAFTVDGQINTDPTLVASWNEYFNLPTNGTPFTDVYITTYSGPFIELILIGGSNISLNTPAGQREDIIRENLYYILDDGGSVVSVEDGTYFDCQQLLNVNLPACLEIKSSGFEDSQKLQIVNAPNLLQIGERAFRRTSSLPYVYYPLVTDVGNLAFLGSAVSVVNISSATTVGNEAFNGCSNLSSLDASSLVNVGVTNTCASGLGNSVFDGISGNPITIKIPVALTTCNAGGNQTDLQNLIDNNTVTVITT
jgi:hypothetical protein